MTTTQLWKWKIYCTTDEKFECIWQTSTPTVCPVNAGHSVDVNKCSKESIIDAITVTNTNSPHDLYQCAILSDTSAGNVTINLPKAIRTNGGTGLVKQITAGNNTIIIPASGDLISSLPTKILTAENECVILRSNGISNWTLHTQETNIDAKNFPLSIEQIGKGIITEVEFGYLSGLTGNIQEQIDDMLTSSQTFTNKTLDADNNNITNIADAEIKTGASIDATKIHDGSVSNTEFGYLNGLTSSIQTQFDGLSNVVFGSQFHQVSSDSESTTTSTALQTKTTLTTSSLPSGTYRLGYSFEVSNASNSVLTEVEVKLDGSVVALPTMEADNDYLLFSGFVYQSLSGIITATIKHRVQTSGISKIKRARLELWRVN